MGGNDPPSFIAFVREQLRQVVNARVALDRASLLPSIFFGGSMVGLLMSFATELEATIWTLAPQLPPWVRDVLQRHELQVSFLPNRGSGAGDDDAARHSDKPAADLASFTAGLTPSGGFVAGKNEHTDVVKLLNTLLFFLGSTFWCARRRLATSPWVD